MRRAGCRRLCPAPFSTRVSRPTHVSTLSKRGDVQGLARVPHAVRGGVRLWLRIHEEYAK